MQKQDTTDTSGIVKPKKLFGLGGSYSPDQLHESSQDAEDQPEKIEPRGMQPAVKANPDQPSCESRSRKNKS